MTTSRHPRTPRVAAVAVLLAVAVLVPASGATSRTSLEAPSLASKSSARIDPNLAAQLAAGPAPAILAWDDDSTDRATVASHLTASGVRFHMFEALDMAIACMAGASELDAVASTPGALSVWGDHALTPALDRSVRSAFNGPPEDIWTVQGITGEGVAVAVLDTGIDATHPDLAFGERTKLNVQAHFSHRELLGPGNDACLPDQYSDNMEDTETVSGHGTHIASVAAGDGTASNGRYKGMAPGADLVGVSVVNEVKSPGATIQGTQPSLTRAIAGVNYVLLNGLEGDVLVKAALFGWTTDGIHDPWHPVTLALRDLYDFGISVIFPVGNEGPETSSCDAAETCHLNPFAVGEYQIGVGATQTTDRMELADFSSRGDPVQRERFGIPVTYEPTLVAPGTHVFAAKRIGTAPFGTLPGEHQAGADNGGKLKLDEHYQPLTGTSVSAAHVAGTVALMQQAAVEAKGCYLTSRQVKQILEQTATPMPGYARHEVGSGALDATAAVWGARFAEKIETREPWMCP